MRNFKIKLYFILLGCLILAIVLIRFLSNIENVDKGNLHQLNVELLSEMKIFKGTKYSYVYKFWTKNHPVEFVIDANDLLSNDRTLVEKLKKEDSITIFIKKKYIENLTKKSKRIRVYQILKNGREYLKE